jgi:hypothetical protein
MSLTDLLNAGDGLFALIAKYPRATDRAESVVCYVHLLMQKTNGASPQTNDHDPPTNERRGAGFSPHVEVNERRRGQPTKRSVDDCRQFRWRGGYCSERGLRERMWVGIRRVVGSPGVRRFTEVQSACISRPIAHLDCAG